MERALIRDYRTALSRALSGLDTATLPAAIALAQSASRIRGYGHVKHASIAALGDSWAVHAEESATTDRVRESVEV